MSLTTRTRTDFPARPKSDEALLDLVNYRYKHSKNVYQTLKTKTSRWHDLYKMVHRGNFDKGRHNVALPLILSTIQSDVSRKLNTLMNVWPIVGMFGFGPEDAAVARKNELLISAQLLDSDSYVKAYDFLWSADTYGTGILQHGWKYDEEDLIRREQIALPASMKMAEVLRTQTAITYDGPDWEPFDLVDAFPQPGQHNMLDMGWFIRRQRMDLDEVRQLADFDIYDKSALSKLETLTMLGDVEASVNDRTSHNWSPTSQAENMRTERFARPIEIWEMWGTVPSEMVPDDGGTQRVVTIANGRVILRNRPNPFWHGKKPFLNYSPIRDPHEFFGMGKAEISEKLQYTANKMVCSKLDALDLFIHPQFIGNKNAIIDRRKLKTAPGAVHWVEGPPQEALQALVPNMTGVQQTYQEVQDIWNWIQIGSGIFEGAGMGGSGGPDRETARGFMGRQEAMSVRLMMEAQLAEQQFLIPLAQSYRTYNRQFLTVPKEMRVLGMNASMNPITGEPIPQEELVVGMDDLYYDYDVRAMGSTQALGKQEKVQRLAGLFQMAASHPAGMALVNWTAFFREMFLANELMNTQELLNPPPSQMGKIQQAQMVPQGANGGGDPGASKQGEGGGGPPVDLSAGLGGLPPLPPAMG